MHPEDNETLNIIVAIIVLTSALSFSFILISNYEIIPKILIFSLIIISVPILTRKSIASLLDASAIHQIWQVYRYGLDTKFHFKKEVPFGIFVPILSSLLTLGKMPFLCLLTYETRILKRRASKRFGIYSYTEMTDFHNALIGASGIIASLILSVVSYFIGYELLAKYSAFYALFNMLPISNLDGTQIFFGSRILWTTLAVVTLIFFMYAIALV